MQPLSEFEILIGMFSLGICIWMALIYPKRSSRQSQSDEAFDTALWVSTGILKTQERPKELIAVQQPIAIYQAAHAVSSKDSKTQDLYEDSLETIIEKLCELGRPSIFKGNSGTWHVLLKMHNNLKNCEFEVKASYSEEPLKAKCIECLENARTAVRMTQPASNQMH